ncbi:potassium channel family protein [Zhihengliuella alba]|uniref:Potassium channel family protein n=1 Tax=Zhihengliuella alba TaxID=547018 RepID=A0ABP7DR87_9MICC
MTENLTRVERWERRVEIPLILLALAFLAAYAWPVLDESIPRTLKRFLETVSWTIWGAFALDFAVRLALAEQRGRYALRHWYDAVLIALPMLRPLRILRVLSAARLLNRVFTRHLVGRVSVYVTTTAIACVLLGAIAILDVEQDAPGANITNFGDAVWWAIVTSATVGYGDFYPVTAAGRFIAVGLMLVGIALLGSITAGVAAWVTTAVAQEDSRGPAVRAESQDGA